jgi:1,4-alpha-glucan branching enzyme
MTPVPHHGWRVGVPAGATRWRELLNTDSAHYGGSNLGNGGEVTVDAVPAQAHGQSLSLVLPPLATVYLVPA